MSGGQMSAKVEVDFISRVTGSISQGAVAAVVGAILGALTEPTVNRVLVERITIQQALADFDIQKTLKFFQTTMRVNLFKFPLYEAINTMIKRVQIPESGKGAIVGAIFTTISLPFGNYRFCQSMTPPIPTTFESLTKAYLPTLGRDIVYGIARNAVENLLKTNYPSLGKSPAGQFIAMFATALAACVISSPFNELRGYSLQPPSKRKSFGEFFKPKKYLTSTALGASNLALALATGKLVVDPVKVFLTKLRETVHPGVLFVLALAVFGVIKVRFKYSKSEINSTNKSDTDTGIESEPSQN